MKQTSYQYFFFISFFLNDTPTTEIYTLSLHDALPIYLLLDCDFLVNQVAAAACQQLEPEPVRSEDHTSELQSQSNLVCRLLLEKKNAAAPPSPRTQVETTERRVRPVAALFRAVTSSQADCASQLRRNAD